MTSDCKTEGFVLYISSVSASPAIEKHTDRVKLLLTNFKITATEVDIAQFEADKNYMHKNSKAEKPNAIPQLFKDGQYIGDYDTLEESNEGGELADLLGVKK